VDHNITRKGSEESTITSHGRFNTFVAGNLNIAAVKEGDTDDQRVWKCYIDNIQLNVNAGGSESKIVASDQPPGEFIIYRRNHRGHWGTSSPISETPGPAIHWSRLAYKVLENVQISAVVVNQNPYSRLEVNSPS